MTTTRSDWLNSQGTGLFDLVCSVVKAKLKPQNRREADDVEDVIGTTMVAVLSVIQKADEESIGSLEAYAKTVAHNEVSRYLARKNPHRNHLATKLGYLVRKNVGFAVWQNPKSRRTVIGFGVWKEDGTLADSTRIAKMQAQPNEVANLLFPEGANLGSGLPETVKKALDWLGGSVSVHVLLQFLTKAAGYSEDANAEQFECGERSTRFDAEVEGRAKLQSIWDCVLSMPLEYRQALLMNLRDADGQGDVRQFIALGIVSKAELASALDLSEDLFTLLLEDLPMSDIDLAKFMGIDGKKVFSVRFCARRRLANELEKLGW